MLDASSATIDDNTEANTCAEDDEAASLAATSAAAEVDMPGGVLNSSTKEAISSVGGRGGHWYVSPAARLVKEPILLSDLFSIGVNC